MKKLPVILALLMGEIVFSQTNLPVNNLSPQEPGIITDYGVNINMNNVWGNKDPNYYFSIQQTDSNDVYQRLKEGLVMQGGQLKVVRNGYLFKMHGSFPLKNGAFLLTDGIIKMPDGSTPVLDENSYMDFEGHIKPLR